MRPATLFDQPWLHARRSDPDTSHQAAAKAIGNSPLRSSVLHVHALHPAGLTDDELKQLLPDAHPGSVAKRRKDLHTVGYVRQSDETRPTRYNSPAIVWIITERGLDNTQWETL